VAPRAVGTLGLGGETGPGGGAHQVVVPGLHEAVMDVHGWFPSAEASGGLGPGLCFGRVAGPVAGWPGV
jgi:hypothetical protein